MELINQKTSEIEDIEPIWCKIPGHENFKTKNEAINAILGIMNKIVAGRNEGETSKALEESEEFFG
jgi:hypothetical protein